MTPDSITYNLTPKRRFATTTTLTGLLVGGSVVLTGGGSLVQQLVVTALVTTIVSGGTYWLLCRFAASVTDGTGHYRIQRPIHENPTRAENKRSVGGRKAGDESTLQKVQ
jgi:hypothetical protein